MRFVLFIVILVSVVIHAGDEVNPDYTKFGDAITTYYMAPSLEKLKAIDEGITRLSTELDKSNFGQMTTVGLALAAKEQGYEIVGLTKVHTDAKKLMTDNWGNLQRYLNDVSSVDPGKLDIWWTSFFMTGNEKYLQYILDVAVTEEKTKEGLNLAVSAAQWSFKANCGQHTAVLRFARKVNFVLRNKYLDECIDGAKK
jgi:hypothetical protein